MERVTLKKLGILLDGVNKFLDLDIKNKNFNGFNHLMVNGNMIFTGSNRECTNFLAGLVALQCFTNKN